MKLKRCTCHVVGIETHQAAILSQYKQAGHNYTRLGLITIVWCALNALGRVNAASSGLLKGVFMLWNLKWQEHGRDCCQTKTSILVLTWSYNWILLWYLSCYHKQWHFFIQDEWSCKPLYSVTQWSQYLYNITSPENGRSILHDGIKICLGS